MAYKDAIYENTPVQVKYQPITIPMPKNIPKDMAIFTSSMFLGTIFDKISMFVAPPLI
jgi:hypothetical protein